MEEFFDTLSRRQFLMASAAGMMLSSIPLDAMAAPDDIIVPLNDYKPVFFKAKEWAFVLAATARLIPSEGNGPGATEARVPVFIDRQMLTGFGKAADWYMDGPHMADADPTRGWQTPLSPAEIYQAAIPAFDAWCLEKHGAIFAELPAATQDVALTALQKGDVQLDATLRGFFGLLLSNTKEGYFADPMYGGNHGMEAWSYIGFPGARAGYREWASRFNVKYPLGPVSIKGERA